ncbi:MAG: sulfatase-like hydrolase/transferase [Planctomycetaceae bacterium]|nr:sulfatase-like hydrolase/transferase [Planctomycetaceae bacterium]
MNHSYRYQLSRWFIGMLVVVMGCGVALWWVRLSPRYNVLLVTLDTTRADHLGCYGHAEAFTPTLDALARDGVLFEQAYVTVPLTLPAHASILTGLYPPENGMDDNGRGHLDPQLPNLTESLRQAGYRTGAFLASVVLHSRYGLNHGFDVYDDDMAGGEQHGHEMHLMRNADIVVDRTLEWLNSLQDDSFFCWVHLFDPHAPYESHEEVFGDRFADRPYDGDIAFADQHIGRLVANLKDRGLYDNTLIVVVGDHGEGLGEHLEDEHGFMLYNSTLRVPLIISAPRRCLSGHRVSTPVSQVDILPTVLAFLDIEPETAVTISGRSLSAAMQGSNIEPRVCYSESKSLYHAFGWAPLESVTKEDWKYIKTTREELYDLKGDPNELNNLAESQPDQLREMQELFIHVQQNMNVRAAGNVELSENERRKLETLGYLSASSEQPSEETTNALPDVKDMIVHYNTEIKARELIREGKADEAVKRMQVVVAAAPSFIPARMTLGTALQSMGRDDEAVEVFQSAISSDPDAASPHFELGKHYAASGLNELAIEHYQRALQLKPEDAMSHFNLGSLLFSQGNTEEAFAHYEQGLSKFPDSIVGNFNFSILLATQGHFQRALQHAERATELSPRNPQIRFQLGQLYASVGNFEDAVTQFEQTLLLNPDYPQGAEFLNQARIALSNQ